MLKISTRQNIVENGHLYEALLGARLCLTKLRSLGSITDSPRRRSQRRPRVASTSSTELRSRPSPVNAFYIPLKFFNYNREIAAYYQFHRHREGLFPGNSGFNSLRLT